LLFRILIAKTGRDYFAIEPGPACVLLKKKVCVVGEGNDQEEDDCLHVVFEAGVVALTDEEDLEENDEEHGQFDGKGFKLADCGSVHE
jgi:hypothetical protein